MIGATPKAFPGRHRSDLCQARALQSVNHGCRQGHLSPCLLPPGKPPGRLLQRRKVDEEARSEPKTPFTDRAACDTTWN